MGCYDTINVKCVCGKRTSSQTKVLGDCLLMVWKEGDLINNSDYFNCIFGLKNKCEHCGKQVNIQIGMREIIKTIPDDPNGYILPYYIEGLWGEVTLKKRK